MKKLFTLAAGVMMVALLNAQGTTQEEYNYLTKGLKIQWESGLDTKRGYNLFKSTSHREVANDGKTVVRTCDFVALVRTGETTPCALLCLFEYSGKKDFICIPHISSTQSVWNQYFTQMLGYDIYNSRFLSIAMGKASSFFSQRFNATTK